MSLLTHTLTKSHEFSHFFTNINSHAMCSLLNADTLSRTLFTALINAETLSRTLFTHSEQSPTDSDILSHELLFTY